MNIEKKSRSRLSNLSGNIFVAVNMTLRVTEKERLTFDYLVS